MSNESSELGKNKFLKAIIFVATRTFVLYLIAFFIFMMFFEGGEVFQRARLKALNRIRPEEFETLRKLAYDKKEVAKEKLEEYEYFYKKVTEYIKGRSDAYGMLGFCYYHLGDKKKSFYYYKKAIDISPNFFTFYYNLGVLCLEEKDYPQAIAFFAKAIKTNVIKNISFITSSRLYFPIYMREEDMEGWIGEQLRENYFDGYRFLIISLYHEKEYERIIMYSQEAIYSKLPNPALFKYYRALATYELKDYKAALFLFKEVIADDPENADAFNYLGLCLKAIGQEENGNAALRQAQIFYKKNRPASPLEAEAGLKLF